MNEGGFLSYHCYNAVKIHFKSKTYDINNGLPKKDVFIKNWNEKHFDKDGKLYYIVEQNYPKKLELIYLYSTYQWYDKSFYVADVITDKFQLWEKHKKELMNLERTLDNDLTTIMEHCVNNNIKLKLLLCDASILRLNISPFSLNVISAVFNITKRIDCNLLSNLEKEKVESKLFYLDKLTSVCHNKLKNKDWKEFIKERLK
jgi:hypothetical protein